MDFTVTMQPGDNFKVVASCDKDYLNGLTVVGTDIKDSGGAALDTSKATVSDMLTVWRKVYVERDVMKRPTFAQNSVSGEITKVDLVQFAGTNSEAFRFNRGLSISW